MTVSEQEPLHVSEQMPPLLLASASPRRREILGRLGFPFRIVPADLDEDAFAAAFQGSFPDLVEALAVEKARAVAANEPAFDGLILAADTTVILEGEMLSKPVDSAEAEQMLRRLRGRAHVVATGVALYDCRNASLTSGQRCTTVWMRDYSDAEIAAYVATGDPLDKAGSLRGAARDLSSGRAGGRLLSDGGGLASLPGGTLVACPRYSGCSAAVGERRAGLFVVGKLQAAVPAGSDGIK